MAFADGVLTLIAQASGGLVESGASTATPAPEAPGGFSSLIILFGVFILLYWLLIGRPQKKEQDQRDKALNELKKGDKVVTIGGLHGTVQEVDKEAQTVTLQVDKSVRLVFNRSAITIPPKTEPKPAAAGADKGAAASTQPAKT